MILSTSNKYLLILLPFFFLSIWKKSYSQNLIPNPGFEIYSNCPNNLSQVNKCIGWINVERTPDYFNGCAPPNIYSVPVNTVGYQPAHSGCGYCGFFSLSETPTGYREYFQAQLTSALVVGVKYYFSFNLALCDGGLNQAWTAGSNKMGFRLSTMSYLPGDNGSPATDNFATFYTDSILTDTINWTTIHGSLVADSAYNYITFGNFFDAAHIQYIVLAGFGTDSYYYIDDVCLSTDSMTCISVSDTCRTSPFNGIEESNLESNIHIYPNPFYNKINVELKSMGEMEFTLYDVFGRKQHDQIVNQNASFNTEKLLPGIYFYEVKAKKEMMKAGKLIKG